MIVAPATANIIGKMACGIADDALSTLLLSFRKPTFVCPAMNTQMLESPVLQRNLDSLRQLGIQVIESTSGELACGATGDGRMAEPETIVERVVAMLSQQAPYAGRRILITAGPTYERIDPVRFIGNYSSGKMGIALAEECARRGAAVDLVLGPVQRSTSVQGINVIHVESAQQMWEAASLRFPESDAAILCAAVADFTPDTVSDQKIKREGDGLVLRLRPTQDIAKGLGALKRPGQKLVGFALETNDELPHAQEKLRKKNLDFIVLNSLQDEGAGFQHDTNKITIVTPTDVFPYPLKPKTEVAADIIDYLESEYNK
jgi:phosphopantothenoylcysteine decarboxylase/phosphopantothenate--cysteine ligase